MHLIQYYCSCRLMLYSWRRVCFIKTTNLDGESNLKIRRPVDLGTGDELLNSGAVMGLKGVLQCEPPNANLHQFQGRFEAGMPNKAIPCESVLAHQQQLTTRARTKESTRV